VALTALDTLLAVQEQDRTLYRLNRDITDIPTRSKHVQDILEGHRQTLHKAVEEAKKTGTHIHQLEGEVEERKGKIRRYREQQFQIKSNEEYRALEHEISLVQKEIRALEDQALQLMEGVESAQGDHQRREQDFQAEEARAREDLAALEQRAQNLQAELAAARQKREDLAVGLPPQDLQRYERILGKTHDYAIVPIQNGACGGCHMNLPPHIINDARRPDTLANCVFCGRLLYWQP